MRKEEEENNGSLFVFLLTNEMRLFNKKNNSYVIAASVATPININNNTANAIPAITMVFYIFQKMELMSC
jgi:hypothetical protein